MMQRGKLGGLLPLFFFCSMPMYSRTNGTLCICASVKNKLAFFILRYVLILRDRVQGIQIEAYLGFSRNSSYEILGSYHSHSLLESIAYAPFAVSSSGRRIIGPLSTLPEI